LFRATSLLSIILVLSSSYKPVLAQPDCLPLLHLTTALDSPLAFRDRGRWIPVPQQVAQLP